MAIRLKKRTSYLADIVAFFESFSVELEYSMSDLPVIVKRLSDSQMCGCVSFLKECAVLFENGTDFPVAWSQAVTGNTPLLNVKERDKLLNFGLTLGTTDISGQKKLIDLFRGYFDTFFRQAKSCEEKFYAIYILSGVLAGFGVFILII